MKPEIDSDV